MSQLEYHWATALIGKPYADDGEGPDEFNCWGLVRWIFVNVLRMDMPRIAVGDNDDDRASAILQVERATGWRPCSDPLPKDMDIALMWGPYGRHVALALEVNGGIFVLHSLEGTGVVLTPFDDLWQTAYKDITLWRRAK